MHMRMVTVFGGTGFLGGPIVRHLFEHGFAIRVASRHPQQNRIWSDPNDPRLQSIGVDIHDEPSVVRAIAGANGAVNAVSLYVERGSETFRSVHIDCARRIAVLARRAGLEALVHISGIGADAESRSPYIRSRGEGERAVQDAFPDAILVRPAVMFGQGDAFLTPILDLLRRLPVYPMFGRGRTRLEPAYVEDVAEAVVRTLERIGTGSITFECGGPRVYSYEELLRSLAREFGLRPVLWPVPFAIWHALAHLAEILPRPPITRNQVELMQLDNVASAQMPGFHELGISPRTIEEVIPLLLRNGQSELMHS